VFSGVGKVEKCKRRIQYSSTLSVFRCWESLRSAKGDSSILRLRVFSGVGISLRTAKGESSILRLRVFSCVGIASEQQKENPVFLHFKCFALLGLA
jgi:hypothetical protein